MANFDRLHKNAPNTDVKKMSDVKRLEKQFSSIFAGRRASLSPARNVGHKYVENLLRGTYSLQRAKKRDRKTVLEFAPLFL